MQSALKKYEAKVEEIIDETPRVKTFRLTFDGIEDFTFEPGEYFLMSIPGFVNSSGIVVRKAYSIANSPTEKGRIDLTITAKSPIGLSTRSQGLAVGDVVILEGPAGKFRLSDNLGNRIGFISGGSGLSSLRSMIKSLLDSGFDGEVKLLQGCRLPEDQIYKQDLDSWKSDKFSVVPSMSQECEWDGLKGRVTEVVEDVFDDITTWQFYICGPPEMVKDTINKLVSLGVERGKIYREVW
jgi:phenol hydroxylase P5 protein